MGERLLRSFDEMSCRHELIKSVRGKGLMIGIEFGSPRSSRLKASWNVIETASNGLFAQLIVIPLFSDHKVLTQVAGHGSHTIKLLPALTISDEDCTWIERSFETVIAGAHRTTGAVWRLGKTLVKNAVRSGSTTPTAIKNASWLRMRSWVRFFFCTFYRHAAASNRKRAPPLASDQTII